MTPAEALARRAVAAPGWRWLPGMRVVDGGIAYRVTSGPHRAEGLNVFDIPAGVWLASESPTEEDRYDLRDEAIVGPPDLEDPATLGCLLALVREAYAAPSLYCRPVSWASGRITAWAVRAYPSEMSPHGDEVGRGPSEAEALVAALEAAPVRR